MKRDIKINYGSLNKLVYQLDRYSKALIQMKTSVTSIWKVLQDGKGQTMNHLSGKAGELTSKIDGVKKEVDDLHNIFKSYTSDMTGIISPVAEDKMMEVDRDDIYWNKESINGYCMNVSLIPSTVSTYPDFDFPNFGEDDEDEEREERARWRRNDEKLREIKSLLTRSSGQFQTMIRQMDKLYEKVKQYENMDDSYQKKAKALKKEYTDFWEGVGDVLSFLKNGTESLVSGIFDGVVDLLKGLVDLAAGIIKYVSAAVVIDFSALTGGETPDWANGYFNNKTDMILGILKDPTIVVEGMAQGVSDAYEEKGASYCVGYALPVVASFLVGDKGASKASEAGKVAEVSSTAGEAAKMEEVISTVWDVNEIGSRVTRGIGKASVGDKYSAFGEMSEADGLRYSKYWAIKESTCSSEELYTYLNKIAPDIAEIYLNTGYWPKDIQVPKNGTVLKADGSMNWSKAAEGGYTLNVNGNAIKESFIPKVGEVIDRYGLANGRYTSPVLEGQSYSYTQRSLPYVEELTGYHQYEVVGDFSKIEEYVNNCPDMKLKTEIDATVTAYYDGDYSKLISYKGQVAAVDGWGKGGATQYEFSLTVEQLEKLGLLKEIK